MNCASLLIRTVARGGVPAARRTPRRGLGRAAMVALLLSGISSVAQAQSSCSVRNPGRNQLLRCSITLGTTLQLPAQALLSLSGSGTNIAGAASATHATFQAAADTGIVVVGPQFGVQSNQGVSVTLVNAPAFTGPVAKPASDVALGVSPTANSCGGVSMTPLSTSPLGVQQGSPRILLASNSPLNNVRRQLCFRVWWRYATDPAGSYSLPLTLSITAP